MNGSNDNEKLIDELANLFNEKAEAHHKAFAATEGEDPDWALWPQQAADPVFKYAMVVGAFAVLTGILFWTRASRKSEEWKSTLDYH